MAAQVNEHHAAPVRFQADPVGNEIKIRHQPHIYLYSQFGCAAVGRDIIQPYLNGSRVNFLLGRIKIESF
jgi:hypothetical protein